MADQIALRTSTDQPSQDRFQGIQPISGTILASFNGAAADPAPIEFTPPSEVSSAVAINVNVSVISGAGATVTINVEGWDKASSTWIPILVSAGLIATGPVQLRVGSNIAAVTNVAANSPLYETMRIRPVKSGTTTTLVYSVGAQFS